MVSVRLQNPTLVLTPISEEEAQADLGFTSLYVLYRDKDGFIQVGIPDMARYFAATANMWGYSSATEKAFFYNGVQTLLDNADKITDRPVYSIAVDDNRQVLGSEIINNVNVNLRDVLNGTFKITENNIDFIMHPDQMKP